MSDATGLAIPRLVPSDGEEPVRWRKWIVPVLSVVEAIFVGSTFSTLSATLVSVLFAGLLVGFVVLWLSGKHSRRGHRRTESLKAESLKAESLKADESRVTFTRRLKAWRGVVIVPVLLAVAAGALAFRVQYHMSGNLNPVAMVVDSTAHATFFLSLTLWVFYPRRGHPAMLGCGLLLVLTTVTAGGVSHTINGQLVAALATVIAFSLAADHILGLWQVEKARRKQLDRSARKIRSQDDGQAFWDALPQSSVSVSADQGRTAFLFSALTLSVLMMSTSALGHLTARFVPGMQLTIFDRLTQSLEAVTSNSFIGGTRYVRGSRLGAIRQHMVGDPAEPALRAYAKSEPGYMRGTVFDTYTAGAWSSISERPGALRTLSEAMRPRSADVTSSAVTTLNEPSSTPLSRFKIRDSSDETFVGTVEVHNYPYKGQLVFTALSTNWIEASTQGAMISHHDIVVAGVDTQEPYVLGVTSQNPRERLDQVRRGVLLAIQPELRRRIDPIVSVVCAGRLTAKSKSKAIEDFFQSNFTYSLNRTPAPARSDPVLHFLETQHPAHCEFFASAAALMLRCVGVPTRYVTGYVVREMTDDGDYWLARNRDAHAWVEAYDDISQQWFPVEATVGRTYRTLSMSQQLESDTSDETESLLDLEEDQTWLGQAVGWLLSFRASDSLTFVFRIGQLPLFCFLLLLLWIRNRQKRLSTDDPVDVQSRQMLSRVDRKIRRFDLVRMPDETLHQFARRVETAAGHVRDEGGFLPSAAAWYRNFAEARYQGRLPSPMEIEGRTA